MEVLVGADPELFVWDKVGQRYVSGHDLCPGTKENPFKVEGGAVQVDGLALEFNIDPAKSLDEFEKRIFGVRKQLEDIVGDGYELRAVPSVEFDKEYYDSLPDDIKKVGCDPEFDAYTEEVREPVPSGNIRCGAGHIHVGWRDDADIKSPNHRADCFTLAKQFDHYLGVYSRYWDFDKQRVVSYGRPGGCRIKTYGVEYRTLSNAWLNDPELVKFVYSQTITAVNDLFKGWWAPDKVPDPIGAYIQGNAYFSEYKQFGCKQRPFLSEAIYKQYANKRMRG